MNVGKLTRNAASLESIVVQQYRDIKSRLAIKSDYDVAKVSVELSSDCPSPEDYQNLKICKNILENQVKHFTSNKLNVWFIREAQ